MSNAGRKITNNQCFEVWRLADSDKKITAVLEYVLTYYNLTDIPALIKDSIKKTVKFFSMRSGVIWRSCNRKLEILKTKYKVWLDKDLALDSIVLDYIASQTTSKDQGIRGRPRKSFDDINLASKKRRVMDIVQSREPEEIEFAAKWINKSSCSTTSSLSPYDALALYIDLGLSMRKYNRLREVINKLHPDTFPSYYTLMKLRDDLLPSSINSTETQVEVDLQDLLTKTVESIIRCVEKDETLTPGSNLKLTCKWGFDGSSGHSTYKQRFQNAEDTDEYLFMTALVPICLVSSERNEVIWQNPTPSSTYYCRPFRIIFTKETSQLIKDEELRVNQLINNLESSVIKLLKSDDFVTVSYDLHLTMIDGAVCHTLSDVKSTQTCYICGATPKIMNTASVSERIPNTDTYKYGLSTLHNWIRSFEFCIHVAYRLPLKCWQVRGETNKQIFSETKKRIQKEFKEKMGLIVDKPKPGFGSTNDGNTARTFFKNYTLSSEITGIDETLIKNFHLINRILSSGFKIKIDKFKALLKETNDLYLSLYSWYNIPMSIHKILIHSPELIQYFPLPIGQLSEDALEGRHKDIRNLRESHTRKTARQDTNHDLLSVMLITSDPYLSTIRSSNRHKKHILDPIINQYLDVDTVS